MRKTDDNIRHVLASHTGKKVIEIEVNGVVSKLENSNFLLVDNCKKIRI